MVNTAFAVDLLRQKFGDAVQENVTLAPYTSARIGGSGAGLWTFRRRRRTGNGSSHSGSARMRLS